MDNPRPKQVTTEDLRDWFGKGKEGGAGGGGWDRYNTKGERIGKCGDAEDRGGDGEGKPKCLSKQKATQLRAKGGKEAIANAVKRKKAQDSVTDRQGTGNAPRPVSNRIGEDVLSEKNVPTNPGLWSRAKSAAKAKFDVYPSAYANGWASKWYKSKGGGWKSEETEDPSDTQSATSADLEWGSDSATRIYRAMTPGQENEAWEKNPNCQQCGKKLSPQDLKKGNRICVSCHTKNKGKVWGKDSDDDYTESVTEAYLTELGNRPYPFHVTISLPHQQMQAQFTIPETGMVYKVDLWVTKHTNYHTRPGVPGPPPTPSEWEFGFGQYDPKDAAWNSTAMGNDSIIGHTGVEIPVFATVAAILKQFVHIVHPATIVYSAKVPSRQRLYARFTRLVQHIIPGYTGREVSPGQYQIRRNDTMKESIDESEYEGRTVTLNKPFRTSGGPKKFSVYVNNEKGNVVKVNFGDPDMEIKRDDPDRRANYRARHNCDDPGPKWKANYWSCKNWSSTPVSKITEEPTMRIPSFKEYLHPSSLREDMTPTLTTNVPPPEMESWMEKNKSAYVKQHGEEVGMSMLTAAAWDMHNREKSERDSSMTEEVGDETRMALSQLKSISDRAMDSHRVIESTGVMELPAWVQSKITEADSSTTTVHDYLMYSPSDEITDVPVTEAFSQPYGQLFNQVKATFAKMVPEDQIYAAAEICEYLTSQSLYSPEKSDLRAFAQQLYKLHDRVNARSSGNPFARSH